MIAISPARTRLAAATLALGALSLAACSGGGEAAAEPTPGAGGGLTEVRVGYFPLVHTASVVHADEAGYFEDEGLDVELVQTAGGAQAIPPLVAGENHITYGNYTSTLLGAQQGLPLTIVAGNDVGAADHGIVVLADSGLESPADLVGHSVAVNNLENIGTVAVRAIVEADGGDPSAVEFVEMPYPDMQAALERGDVDAIWQVEPFQARALTAGHEVLFELFSGPVAGMPVAGWLSTTQYAEENPDVIEAFQRAMTASAADLEDNRELLVELVPTYTEVAPETVEAVAMPMWDPEVDVEQLTKMADLMLEYGIISDAFDVTTIIAN